VELDRRALAVRLGGAVAPYHPPSQRLLLGWLLVCSPPEQTQADLRDQLGLSLGSVSSALNEFVRLGVVEKLPAGKGSTYRIREDAWPTALGHALEVLDVALQEARRGVKELDAQGDVRARDNVQAVLSYLEASQAPLMEVLRGLRS
jgi:DNA-binding IclR family transcriptional regulator